MYVMAGNSVAIDIHEDIVFKTMTDGRDTDFHAVQGVATLMHDWPHCGG
jgi:hypothetical protein